MASLSLVQIKEKESLYAPWLLPSALHKVALTHYLHPIITRAAINRARLVDAQGIPSQCLKRILCPSVSSLSLSLCLSPFLPLIYLYVCVWLCMLSCAFMCGDQRTTSSWLHHISSNCLLETLLSTGMKLAKPAKQTFQQASASFCLHLPDAGVLNFCYSGDCLLFSVLGIELIFSCKARGLQFMLSPQQSLILSGNITKKKTVASFTTTVIMFHHTVSRIWRENYNCIHWSNPFHVYKSTCFWHDQFRTYHYLFYMLWEEVKAIETGEIRVTFRKGQTYYFVREADFTLVFRHVSKDALLGHSLLLT